MKRTVWLMSAILVWGQQRPPIIVNAPPPQQQQRPPAPATPPPQPAAPTTTPQTQPPALPAMTETGGFFLQNASLVEVIDLIAKRLKINYILDPRVKGTVSINTYGETRPADLRQLLETILRMNGFAIVQVGEIHRIVPIGEVSRLPLNPKTAGKDIPEDERMVLNLVFLKYATSAELSKLLEPFLGEGAKMISYDPANLLILLDNSRNMKRTMELISLFDSDTLAGQRVRLFETSNGRPSDIVKDLESIFKAVSMSDKTSSVKFMPIDRINTIIAVAPNPGVFAEVEKWVKKLDMPVKVTAGSVDNYVYRLKYGRAETVGMAVMALYGGYGGFGFPGGGYPGGGYPGGGYPGGGYPGGGYPGGGYPGGAYPGGAYPGGMSPYGMGVLTTSPAGLGMQGTGGAPLTGAAPGTMGPAGATTTAGTGDLTGSFLGFPQMMGAPGKTPRIIPNPFDNTLLVQATPQEWEQISKLLEQLDIPPRQVLIDAKIYEVTLNKAFSSAVSAVLQTGTTPGARRNASSLARTLLVDRNDILGLKLSSAMLVGQSRQLLAVVTAQESAGNAKTISEPSIIATDSIPATINAGTEVPILTSQAVAGVQSGGTSLFTNTVSSRNTGISLNIVARVNSSGVVTLVINQEVSAPQAPAAGGINSPSFQKRNVSTQVTVEDGDTIAIGGVIQESDSYNTSGIPVLHRIPGLGALFGSKSISKARTELIVFLRPRVIYDTAQVAEASEELKSKLKRLRKLIKE